jgi:hypothetical protein
MIWPHAIVPSLDTTVDAGTHWLVCLVGASDDAAAVTPPKAPAIPDTVRQLLDEFAAQPDPAPAEVT